MPTYTYHCSNCDAKFEQVQKFSDDPVKTCPSCGGEVRRVFHPVGVVFKGSGWYITDSRKSASSSTPSATSSPATTAESTTAPESKPESKPAETKAAD